MRDRNDKTTKQEQGIQRKQQEQPQQGRRATPFSLMQRMFEDMDAIFGGGFGRHGDVFGTDLPETSAALGTYVPQLEVFERGDRLVVRADLPGMTKDEIHVSVSGDSMIIEGERKSEHEEETDGIFHSERSYGSFRRHVALPRNTDPSTVDARFDNGVLEITAMMPSQSSRRIDVKTGAQTTAAAPSAPQAREKEIPVQGNGTARHEARH